MAMAMAMTTPTKRRAYLALLLLLATASRGIVGAKDGFVEYNSNHHDDDSHHHHHSSSTSGRRNLQYGINMLQGRNGDHNYVPYSDGTPVVFEDQDGTLLFGKIDGYDSDTQTYTIQWEEDDMREEFSDFNKVDQLVQNWKEKGVEEEEEEEDNDEQQQQQQEQSKAGDFTNNNNNNNNNSREQQENGNAKDDNDSSSIAQSQTMDFGYAYDYGNLGGYEPYPIGTPALLEFADGWFEGKISAFALSDDQTNASYTITWSDGTSDVFVNELEWMDLIVGNAQSYKPWENGTPVYGYPSPNGDDSSSISAGAGAAAYLGGVISSFADGAYTVVWSNGDSVTYYDFDRVDELVNNAGLHLDASGWMEGYDPWPRGTPVSWDFDDGWWEGTITDFSDGTYQVTWSDGSFKYYSNLEKIDRMVAFAGGGDVGDGYNNNNNNNNNNDRYDDYYDLETVVYAQFDDGWWAGYIDSYDGDRYVVRWSDDTVDTFLPSEEVDDMVNNARFIPHDYNIFPVGTKVKKSFNGVWYTGTIEYSNGGFYTILWNDDSRTTYVSGNEVDEMVIEAYKIRLGLSGTIALVVFCVLFVGGVVVHGVRNHKRMVMTMTTMRMKQPQSSADVTESVRENELGLGDDDGDDGTTTTTNNNKNNNNNNNDDDDDETGGSGLV